MNKKVRVIFCCVVVLMSMALTACSGEGSDYPSRTIEMIVPYVPGSGVDLNGRTLLPFYEKTLGGTIVVVNKGGASAGIGCNFVARARKDGYTIGIVNIASLVSTGTMNDVGYHPINDITWIGSVVTDTFLIAAGKDSPFNTIKDVVAYLKDHPGELSYGTSGAMSMDAMLGYNLESTAGVDLNMVSYNGGGEIVVAIMGGHIDLYGGAWSEIKPQVDNGDVKILGVGGDTRIPALPDVPTFAEQGVPMAFNVAKRSVFVPNGTDAEVVKKLEEGLKAAVEDPEFKARSEEMGAGTEFYDAAACNAEAQEVYEWFQANRDKIILE